MESGRWCSWICPPPSVIRPVVVPYPFFCFWANDQRSPFVTSAVPSGWMGTILSGTSANYAPRSSCQSAFSPVPQPERSTSQDKNDAPSHHDSGFFDDSIASSTSSPDKLPEFSYLLQRATVSAALKTGSPEDARKTGLFPLSGSQPFTVFSFGDGGSKVARSDGISLAVAHGQYEAPTKKMGRPPKHAAAAAVTSNKLRPLLSKATSTTSSAMSDASWSCSPEPASPSDNHFIPLFGCTSAGESSHEFPSQLDTVKEEVVVTSECIIPFSTKPLTSEFSKVYTSFVPPKPVHPPPQVNLLSPSSQLPVPEKRKAGEVSPSRKKRKLSAVTSGGSAVNGEPKGASEAKRNCGEPKWANTERKSYRSTSVCDICGREFRYPRSLLTHQLVHQDIRPHKCPYPQCDKSFRQTGHLQTHLLIHTGDKPFKCPVQGCPTQPFRHANRRCPLHNGCRLVKLGGNGETKPLDLSSHPLVFEGAAQLAQPGSPKKSVPTHSPQRGFLENGKQRQEDVAMAMALIQFANGPVPQSQSPAGMK
ncbi:hypothetical protein RvY_00568 [Ramazzottius varieornatus]|uniref:C2H2-type domain-containing protein n=1 Tax=Ramazzottius varieornatus TaxID=947166 RepID=A0A1D1UKH0_RAMVA|nr:hypothetical protein RvY_00568 [Ramazzottius varieornatus]